MFYPADFITPDQSISNFQFQTKISRQGLTLFCTFLQEKKYFLAFKFLKKQKKLVGEKWLKSRQVTK